MQGQEYNTNSGSFVAIGKLRVWVAMITIVSAFLAASNYGVQVIAKDVATTVAKEENKQLEDKIDTVQQSVQGIKIKQEGFSKDIEYIKKSMDKSEMTQERILDILNDLQRRD